MSEKNIPQEEASKSQPHADPETVRQVLKFFINEVRTNNPNATPEELKQQAIQEAKDLLEIIKHDPDAFIGKDGKIELSDKKIREVQQMHDEADIIDLPKRKDAEKKTFRDPKLQEIYDSIQEKIESKKIQEINLTIGGKTRKQLIQELNAPEFNITTSAQEILNDSEFDISSESKSIKLFKLSGKDLGLDTSETYDKILIQARQFGFTYCPIATAAYLRLRDKEQAMNAKSYRVAVKLDTWSRPRQFILFRDKEGVFVLDGRFDPKGTLYDPDELFVFKKVE